MSWYSLLPYVGEQSARAKISELESEAGSLPIIFGVVFGKAIEGIVRWNLNITLRFLAASVVVAIVYIYRREVKRKAKEAKDAAADAASNRGET